jgi:hypothetical protein
MTFVSIAVVILIVAIAFGGMRLMQRTTGCACEVPYDRPAVPDTDNTPR